MYASMTGSHTELPGFQSFINAGLTGRPSTVFQGTGASYFLKHKEVWLKYVQSKTPFSFVFGDESESGLVIKTATVSNIDIRTITAHIENIRSVIDPSMSELAKDLGVTRQAVYKWLAGESVPDDEKKNIFIKTLSLIADEFTKAKIFNAKALFKMKAFNGQSLMNIVRDGGDWEEPVKVLINEACLMKQAAQAANLNTSKTDPSDNWKAYVSIPGSGMRD